LSRCARCILLLFFTLGVAPAEAQHDAGKFEITPFVAFRVGGAFAEEDGDGRIDLGDSSVAGVIFNIRANPKGQYELYYSQQNTDADVRGLLTSDQEIDLDIQHLQFGGTYLFAGEHARPFIALTLGGSRFSPGLSTLSSESFFSASFGAGIQLAPSNRFGVRLEARALTTFVNSDSRIFCASDGGSGSCLIQIDSDLLTQWEASAGLVFRF
jgi:hypothetical protein